MTTELIAKMRGARVATPAIALLFTLLAVQRSIAGEKNDRVPVTDGDRFTGEIKNLDEDP